MPLFLIPDNPGLKNPIELCDDDKHHLTASLRAKVGDQIYLSDNTGTRQRAIIKTLDPLEFELKDRETLPTLKNFTVYLPLISKDRLKWTIEKLCELGVKTVQLIETERTQAQKNEEKLVEKLQKIAAQAQKQCLRPWPVEIFPAIKLSEVKIEGQLGFASLSPSAKFASHNWDGIFIGPEGGFTSQEEEFLKNNKVQGFSLGHQVLRTETAAIAASTLVLIGHSQ